jgi:hypothetical protein
MKRFTSAFSVVFALLLATAPALSHAADLDAALACSTTAHSFFTDLAGQQLIDPKPMRVESNSINAFWPSRGAKLTAFGFPVFAIVGFEKDDPMFRNGDGEPLAKSAYGVVVFGSDTKVQAVVDSLGGTAIVHHAGPHLTAIFCKRS